MKNFVFDLYGTLVDIRTDEESNEFRSAFLREFNNYYGNIDFFKEYRHYIEEITATDSEREPDILDVFLLAAKKNFTPITKNEAVAVAKRFRSLSRSKLELYPYVKDMLTHLHDEGAKVYLLSNAQRCFTMPEIVSLGLDAILDGIELSSDFGFKKPSLRFFTHIIDKYHLSTADTVYIGNDIESDILGSSKAGLKSVYIKTDISPDGDTLEKAESLGAIPTANHRTLADILISLAKS